MKQFSTFIGLALGAAVLAAPAAKADDQAFGDWVLHCADVSGGEKACALHQKIMSQDTKLTVASFAIARNKDSRELRLAVVLPLGIDIPAAFYYLCGPAGMMSEVEKSLAMFDVPEKHILKELFLSTASEETVKAEEDGSLKSQEVTLIFEGKTHTVTVLPSETILEAALEADIDIPYSCQAGMCTACMGLCTSGQVIMDEEDGLTDNEIKKGYILTCVAHPMSEGVVINLD